MKFQKVLLCFAVAIGIGGCAKNSSPVEPPGVQAVTGSPSPTSGAEDCAEELILAAAKTNVANVYGNRPESGGDCALGVRQSLQLSGVGGITGGIGNAIDYVANLPPYGFVATGLVDPNTATPGSVIVFSGPDSASYLQTGQYGTPPGDWLGHVTIKGDDGYYYTDARTVEPAIGWENGVNVDGERDVAAILVPGPALVAEYADKCSSLPETFQNLSYQSTDESLRTGHRQMATVVAQFQQFVKAPANSSDRSTQFHNLLEIGRESLPYDSEGRFTHLVAQAIRTDAGLRTQYDQYLRSLSQNDAAPCKTELLTASINEIQCLQAAGIAGQDFAGSSSDAKAKSCINNFNYQSCLNEKGR